MCPAIDQYHVCNVSADSWGSWNFIRHRDMAHRTSKVKMESLVTCKDPLSKRKMHSRCLRIKPHSSETAQVIGWPHKELCLATSAAVLMLVEQLFFNRKALTYKLKFPQTFFFFFFRNNGAQCLSKKKRKTEWIAEMYPTSPYNESHPLLFLPVYSWPALTVVGMRQVQMVLTDGYCGLNVGLPPSARSPLLLKTASRDRATQLSPTLQPLLTRPDP